MAIPASHVPLCKKVVHDPADLSVSWLQPARGRHHFSASATFASQSISASGCGGDFSAEDCLGHVTIEPDA
jgi:hypothetical protein